jgi:hypothetical protein
VTEQTWTCTRDQLIGALANIEVRHVKLTGPMAGKVIADDVADAILSQLPRAAESTQDSAESHREALNDAGQVSWDSGWGSEALSPAPDAGGER